MKHINVALFVPDEGCPHRCSFCNQKTISGKTKKLTLSDIDKAVEIASEKGDGKGEIAFSRDGDIITLPVSEKVYLSADVDVETLRKAFESALIK